MEIDYFSLKKSSSGKYYFINKITGKTQWGFDTYFHTKKRLPKGWIRLNLNGEAVYKYIRYKIPLTSSLSYSPTYLRELEIFQTRYENLDKKQAEACRRLTLFEEVADLLKIRTDSICDESLDFLARRAKILPKTIIDFIDITESKQLGKKAFLTLFSTIKRNDASFSSERSIRELCGLNMREAEASKAMGEIDEEFSCHITRDIFKDPVTCSSGHTFERDAITTWRQNHTTCPATRVPITTYIVPNHALKKVLEKFVQKYEHQRGDIWKPIVNLCLEYKNFKGRLEQPEYIIVPVSDTNEPFPLHPPDDSDEEESPPDDSDEEESPPDDMEIGEEEEQQYLDMRERQREQEIEENQTGRSEEEIRAFMITYGNLYEVDIPEFIARSRESSYANAIRESVIRYNQLGRTAEEIRAFMIIRGWGIQFIQDIPEYIVIEDIPEYIAQSRYSSYRHTDTELQRRMPPFR